MTTMVGEVADSFGHVPSTEEERIAELDDTSCTQLKKNSLPNSTLGYPGDSESISTGTSVSVSPSSDSEPLQDESTSASPASQIHRDVSMISIAQGGLIRIRRDARTSKVKLIDVINVFGRTLDSMARSNDEKVPKRSSRFQRNAMDVFNSSKHKATPLSQTLWKIVVSLNRYSDPCCFTSDGSSMTASPKLLVPIGDKDGKDEDNSAMGRGLRCLLLALVYVDRICEKHPQSFILTSNNVHKTMLSAIYLATKYSDDSLPQPHQWFSRVGGVSLHTLRKLETTFCALIEFEFYVTEIEFQTHCMEQLRWALRAARTFKQSSSSSRLRQATSA